MFLKLITSNFVLQIIFCIFENKNQIMEKVLFSPGFDCLEAIIEELTKAKEDIKICVFTISDNRIEDVLKKKQSEGINIRIITDNDKRFDLGSDIVALAKIGIPVKVDLTKAHMHHKFAVIDNKVTITGSYNWTRSAQEYNYENIIITENKEATDVFIAEFEKLWSAMISI